jgi:C4-dicarboxylate-specific signal transduction histidine kinase
MYAAVGCAAWIAAGQWVQARQKSEELQGLLDRRAQCEAVNRERMEELYIRCHDLKHQLAALRTQSENAQFGEELSRLEETVRMCGTRVECGNEALNVVLTEKNALCAAEGIHFSYMIDGTLFDFLPETELYSLFGNILDNALEASRKVRDAEMRMISLKAAAKGGRIIIHAENVFEGRLILKDGFPQTDKKGSGHGFGLRSIERTAKKYAGTLGIRTEGQIFKLTVVMNPRIDA